MNRATLLALPFACIGFVGVFAIVALGGDASTLAPVLTVELASERVVAFGGALVAAWTFDRGDYLRSAWLCGAACFVLLLVADLGTTAPIVAAFGARDADLGRGVLALVANVDWVGAMWMLARAWSVAGLDDERSRTRRRIWLVGSAVVAAAIELPPFSHDLGLLLDGNMRALVSIADELGAAVGLALVAPVFQTTLTMRGGVLLWPWGLLTASGLTWVVLDGMTAIGDAFDASGPPFAVATEACRALACAFFGAAGIAQRVTVKTPA